MVSSQDQPQNFPIYSVHSDIDSFILYNADQTQETLLDSIDTEPKEIEVSIQNETNQTLELSNKQGGQISLNEEKFVAPDDENYEHEILWHLEFDGSFNKFGAGTGVWIYNLENNHSEGHAYRLNFKCTNNMVEYEALILGLKLIRNLGAKRVSIMGDSELVIK